MYTATCDLCGLVISKEKSQAVANRTLGMHKRSLHGIASPNYEKNQEYWSKRRDVDKAARSTNSKVRWTTEEVVKMKARMLEIYRGSPSKSALEIIHQAEKDVIPEGRRHLHAFKSAYRAKSGTDRDSIAEYYDRIRYFNGSDQLLVYTQPPAVPAPAAEPAQQAIDYKEPAPQQTPVSEPIKDKDPRRSVSFTDLVSIMIGSFMKDIEERLDRIEAAAIAKINSFEPRFRIPDDERFSFTQDPGLKVDVSRFSGTVPITAAEPHPKPEEPPPNGTHSDKLTKIRIGIVGLMQDQFNHVTLRAKDLPYNLVFINKEWSRPENHIPQGVTWIIVQKHSAHRWYDAAQAAVGSSHTIFADGGITAVEKAVFDIHSRITASRLKPTLTQT